MNIQAFLTDLARDLSSLQHADMIQGVDMTQRGQSLDRMLAKVRAAIVTLDAEAEQAEVKA